MCDRSEIWKWLLHTSLKMSQFVPIFSQLPAFLVCLFPSFTLLFSLCVFGLPTWISSSFKPKDHELSSVYASVPVLLLCNNLIPTLSDLRQQSFRYTLWPYKCGEHLVQQLWLGGLACCCSQMVAGAGTVGVGTGAARGWLASIKLHVVSGLLLGVSPHELFWASSQHGSKTADMAAKSFTRENSSGQGQGCLTCYDLASQL